MLSTSLNSVFLGGIPYKVSIESNDPLKNKVNYLPAILFEQDLESVMRWTLSWHFSAPSDEMFPLTLRLPDSLNPPDQSLVDRELVRRA